MEPEGGGVLRNLPRSRPGTRSGKRDGPASRRPAPPPPRAAGGEGDPVGDAVRALAGVAETGAKVANAVTRELLRRLPRP